MSTAARELHWLDRIDYPVLLGQTLADAARLVALQQQTANAFTVSPQRARRLRERLDLLGEANELIIELLVLALHAADLLHRRGNTVT